MKYEADRSKIGHYFSLNPHPATDFNFPPHFHKSLELVYVEEGELIVQIGQTEFSVLTGQCALILSGQLHAYRTAEHSISHICIFSPDFVSELMHYCKNVQMHHPVFIANKELFARLKENEGNIFALKSLLYGVAAVYASGPALPADTLKSEGLLYDIATFIDDHFAEAITLQTLAEHFGYSYRYMSGLINRHFGLSFAALLQQYRIDLACRLLKETEYRITEITEKCGFDTTRSFNRAFQKVMGMTPKEYRHSQIQRLS